MNKAYLLMLCLISASFTGCLEDEVEYTTQEETIQQENEVIFNVTQDSNNVYYVIVLKVKEKVDLTDLSFYLRDETGSTYVGGNGFGDIGMKMRGEEAHGIDTSYSGNNENLKNRAEVIENDDGSTYPVKYSDNDRDGKISAGDEMKAYGYDVGPVYPGWKIDVKDDLTNQIIGSAKLGEYTGNVESTGADWTFMTYISDSDLEYFSIEDMIEMERVGSTDKVNIVVQIDRWDGYDKPDWNDESNGDWETAKRYLMTKENKGDHVIGSTAIEDIGEINTGDPDELVKFVQWAQTNYPAEHYALNIWNHGSGATGVAYEQSCPDYCWYYGNEADKLELSEIDSALKEITNNGENKLDIVGFDACLMSTIEVVEAVAPYSDIMIGSEILEPGNGWDYSFLQLLVDNPTTTPEQLGAKIVDTFVAQGQTVAESYALTMLDMRMAEYTIDSINALAELKDSTSLISDLEAIRPNSVHVEPGDSSSAVDLLHLLNSLSEYTTDSKVKMAADRAASNVSAMILKAEFNGDPNDIDTTGMTGISILFPNLENEWAKRTKGMSENNQWGELMEDYYDEQEDDLVLFFNESSLIYNTDDFDGDGFNDSISLALEIESLSDGVYGNLTLDVFNNRGYWIDGIEYDFEMNSDEIVYLDLWDVYYVHMLEDGESDLLRIEAVLSIVNTDGTQTLQDWVETPYEYLTAFNESREIPMLDNTIKIGFMNPITGPVEDLAYGIWWGADQAIGDLNDMYPDFDFELIEVNSGCDGDMAQSAALDLIDEGVVAVIGAACSGASMAANNILSEYGIPMISYASSNPGLSDEAEYPLFYRVVPSDAIQGPAGVAMMVDAGVTNESLAILHMTNDYGFGLADSIKSAWEVNGELCSAGMQGYDETASEFSGLVSAIIDDENCEAVYLSSFQTDAAGIIEELHNQGWDGQIFAGDGASGSDLYGQMTDHSMLGDVTVTSPRESVSYGDFEQRYDDNAEEVGGIKYFALTAYDSTMILGKAIAEYDEHHELTDSIEQVGTNYEGASGVINFMENGDSTGSGFDICTYSGDTSDANGGYSCNRFWTVENGVQEY
ncbi:MAG: clostripain-related cysteine peptidase [Candidatus Thermoplasmatota archaeon]|nr:clostripain-related cysteine peptidase [Candidatus Thermoplasmatota archaeon]